MQEKDNVYRDRSRQQQQRNDGDNVHFPADGFKVLEQFLLFQGIAVGSLPYLVEPVFDALER